MVQDSRATTRPRAIKPLNAPEPVAVHADAAGAPEKVRVTLHGIPNRMRPARIVMRRDVQGPWLSVAFIVDIWKINDEWWRGRDEEIERMYFDLLLENGRHMTVFHDLIRDVWYRQSG